MRKHIFLILLCIFVAAPGCVYRANISQGNLVKEENLEQVEVGMTRSQVRFLLGTPMIDDPFNRDRWDYVYYIRVGRKGTQSKRWTSILFENDRVVEVRKDLELDPRL